MRWLCLLALLAGGQAWACSCSAWPSAKDAWKSSPVVFVGYVERTDPDTSPAQKYIGEQAVWVRGDEPFKGVRANQALELNQPGHNCAPKFKQGERALFYLNPTKKAGAWEAFGCDRTQSLESAADDLLFLRACQGRRAGLGFRVRSFCMSSPRRKDSGGPACFREFA